MSGVFERGVVAPRQGLREGLLYEQLSLWYLKLTGNMRKKASESVKAEREQVLHSLPARCARGLCSSRVLLSALTRHLSACIGASDRPLHSCTDSHAGTDAHMCTDRHPGTGRLQQQRRAGPLELLLIWPPSRCHS
jgi:hypothetical protein